MPRSSTPDTLLRQWELLKMLPTHGSGRSVTELMQALNDLGHHTSRRSIERDLRTLQDVFPITCNDRSKPYGWRMKHNTSANLPAITLAEALSLRMIKEIIDPLLPRSIHESLNPRLEEAREVLKQRKSRPRKDNWLDKMRVIPPSLPLHPPAIDPDILHDTQTALLEGKQLEADYAALDSEAATTLTLHPLALVHRSPTTYLVATANDYDDPRIYALHRIRRTEILPDAARRPGNFDIDRYIETGNFQFGNGRFIKLSAIIEPWLEKLLKETPLAEDQNVTCRRSQQRLTATVADSWQLRWWILSLGAGIRITGPAPLKREIENQLREALAGYGP